MTDVIIITLDGQPRVSSLEIAEKFNKKHHHVLERIREVLKGLKQSGMEEWGLSEIRESYYKNEQGKEQPMYLIGEEGFYVIAMGFTGIEALQWKVKFAQAFKSAKQALLQVSDQAVDIKRFASEMMVQLTNTLPVILQPILKQLTYIAEQHSNDINEIKDAMNGFNERLSAIEGSLEKRLYFTEKVRNIHIGTSIDYYQGRCPCCQINGILLPSGKKLRTAEEEHWFSRSRRKVHETWIICRECHKKFTSGEWSRSEKQSKFDAYQENVKDWMRRNLLDQRKLFN